MCSSVKQASLCLLLLFALGSMPCMFTNTIDEVGSFEDCRGLVVCLELLDYMAVW